jgi:hypothetical protein
LICEGTVGLSIANNPHTKVSHEANYKIETKHANKMNNYACGIGVLSPTLNKTLIMSVSKGQWVGEETSFEGMPLFYDAVVQSDLVRVLRISVNNLKLAYKQDKEAITSRMWVRLKFMRDRTKAQHSTREKLMEHESITKDTAMQVEHIN